MVMSVHAVDVCDVIKGGTLYKHGAQLVVLLSGVCFYVVVLSPPSGYVCQNSVCVLCD